MERRKSMFTINRKPSKASYFEVFPVEPIPHEVTRKILVSFCFFVCAMLYKLCFLFSQYIPLLQTKFPKVSVLHHQTYLGYQCFVVESCFVGVHFLWGLICPVYVPLCSCDYLSDLSADPVLTYPPALIS